MSVPPPAFPSTPYLVRRIGPASLEPVRDLIARGSQDPESLMQLLEREATNGVYVLGDVARGPLAAPAAVAVFCMDHERRIARLEYVLVNPSRWQSGLGRSLIETAATLLRADGVVSVEAAVHPASDAEHFLLAVGFVRAGGGLFVYRY